MDYPLDKILPCVCSGSDSKKDHHMRRNAGYREMALNCWFAHQDKVAQADLAGRADVFEQVKNQEV